MPLFAIALLAAPPALGRPIDDIWETDCTAFGKNGRHGIVTQVTISGRKIEAVAQVHATPACALPTFKVFFRGRIDKASDTMPSALRFTVQAIDLTPQHQAVVDQYNRNDDEGRHGCGLSRWKLNEAKSVAGHLCTPFQFAKIGTTLYDAIWIDPDGLMRFGGFPLIWENDAEEKRPVEPLSVAYHRIKR